MTKRKWSAAITLLVLACFLSAWMLGAFGRDTQLAKVREMQKQLLAGSDQNLSDAERRERFRALRTQIEKLPPDEREREMQNGRMAMMHERAKKYFTLANADERKAYLDKQIKDMERMRQRWQQNGGGGRSNGGPPNPPPGDARAAGQNAAGGDQDQSGRGPWRNQDRQARMRTMLDNTTPLQRAQMSEYFRAMDQRRQQLGLPAFGPPFGRR